ncbi:uncharacterized protein [Watersipora subatra]|uniref:uncharacterized protein n=1 Tax=Watersipora subatra TaxID=2589382 RepID=UPI00355AFC44
MDLLSENLPGVYRKFEMTMRWIVLEDCKHMMLEPYMHYLVYKTHEWACPYNFCKKPLWNTRRYFSRTREHKRMSHVVVLPKKNPPTEDSSSQAEQNPNPKGKGRRMKNKKQQREEKAQAGHPKGPAQKQKAAKGQDSDSPPKSGKSRKSGKKRRK